MDRALWDGFRAGERQALERVYWEHVARVEALVRAGLTRAQCFSPANLADVVQEVFTKAFSKKVRSSYDGERDFAPFLRQVARNALVDWLRRQRRHALPDMDWERLADSMEAHGSLDTLAFPPDMVAATRRFVGELSPELRAVHEQRFLEGETQERAARALGVSRQNLRTLERRLLDGLRRALRLAEEPPPAPRTLGASTGALRRTS